MGGRIRDGHEDHLGKTLFTTRELPQGYYRFRIVKLGFQPILASGGILGEPLEFNLDREGSIPADMVRGLVGPLRFQAWIQEKPVRS